MGTSLKAAPQFFLGEDHPHAYGDKDCAIFPVVSISGSSPRVWGQVPSIPIYQTLLRIIPTRMGTSFLPIFCDCIRQDHPHAYGDKSYPTPTFTTSEGSSPRVWGQDYRNYPRMRSEGIIPTRMGTRLKKSRKIAVLQNQPLRFPLTFHRSFV